MSFADNLKKIRKDRGLSQEELADLLDVSRQAVSKWEQGLGYPEVEKLILLSRKLQVSLDTLMSLEHTPEKSSNEEHRTGTITISSPHENVVVTCYKVQSSGRMMGGKNVPHYALFAVSEGASFWGQPTTFLGWYAEKEQISKEVEEILQALMTGVPFYELKYSAKTERRGLKIVIVND